MKQRGKKKLLFIEPCLTSQELIIKAKEKGYTTLVISAHSDDRKLPDTVLNATSSLFQVDTNDNQAVTDLAEKIDEKFNIEGIIPGADSYISLAAHVASCLKKPGLKPKVAEQMSRKDLLRDVLKAKGVPLPNFYKIDSESNLKEALHHVPFPCMIKSVATENKMKVHTYDEAVEAFKSMTQHERTRALLEEYVEGKSFIVEGIMKDGSAHIISLSEKVHSANFKNMGTIVRSKLDPSDETMIFQYIKKILLALRINCGPFQIRLKLSKRGPLLTEINMRFPETYIPQLIEYAVGIDYYDNIIRLLCGQTLALQKTRHLNAGMLFFYACDFGSLNSFEFMLESPFLKEIKSYNDKVMPPDDLPDSQKWGHAIFLHENYEVLKNEMTKIKNPCNQETSSRS